MPTPARRPREDTRPETTAWISYVGSLDDLDFSWSAQVGAPEGRPVPHRVALPGADRFYDLAIDASFVLRAIEEGLCEVKQLDAGAWGRRRTGGEIRALPSDPRIAAWLSALDPDKHYVLVVAEE